MSDDTIFALSSGRPPAAIAVIRISGPRARQGLEAVAGTIPDPRRARLAKLRDPGTGGVLDQGLVLWFPGPNSETGEDMAELHLHGGRAVIAAVLRALGRIEGFRPAEAGEFTRRAFENGRLDLTAVEGLADLVLAETEAQRRQAFAQLTGVLGHRAERWRRELIEALALVEARIDFSDEAEISQDLLTPALGTAAALRAEIAGALADDRRGERLREGLAVAIAGPPNAGKSSLLNRIARRDVAIVSPHAGTTRDVIEVHLDLEGYPVTLLDTAGIRDTTDPVEQEGVRRARERAEAADLVLWVVDATSAEPVDSVAADRSGKAEPTALWLVCNKIDRIESGSKRGASRCVHHESGLFQVSAMTGAGLAELISAIAKHAGEFFDGSEPSLVTRERHRKALLDTIAPLDRAMAEGASRREDLVAEELRLAARALGRLTGRVDVEEVLDVIFRDFCIGK